VWVRTANIGAVSSVFWQYILLCVAACSAPRSCNFASSFLPQHVNVLAARQDVCVAKVYVCARLHLLCPQQTSLHTTCGSDAHWLTCHFDAAPARTSFLQGIKKIATFLNEFGALLLTRRLHSAAVPPRFLATTRALEP
jgi:hypothetical protein